MEINEITQERIAEKLLSAMKREGLMSKEVAKIFDVPASYMSSLIRNRDMDSLITCTTPQRECLPGRSGMRKAPPRTACGRMTTSVTLPSSHGLMLARRLPGRATGYTRSFLRRTP